MTPWKLTQRKQSRQTNSGRQEQKSGRSASKRPAWQGLGRFIVSHWRYLLIGLALLILTLFFYLAKDLPSPANLTSQENYPVSTQIFDRNGKLLYEIYAEENRIPVTLDQLSPHMTQATLAIEDKNFYQHFGLDLAGISRALLNNLRRSDSTQGGSTITQQLVKTALLSSEKTFDRKAKEALLSIVTEILYSKDQILEMYLNYISYGGTAVGVEAAANRYFNKNAKDLSLAEASFLAGLPQAPSSYSPYGSTPELGLARQKEVLRRMVEEKYISQEEANQALAEKLTFAIKKTDIAAPHFVFYVKDLLYQKYGEKTVETGGLRVTTSLDLDLQEVAQATVAAEVATLERLRVNNGAALITKPNTGEILAMVGSKDYFDTQEDGQVNVTLRPRQPGSSIKPIMYATTFQEKTLGPGSMLLDVPTCFKMAGTRDYCPKNYTGGFSGPVTVRQALGSSLNIPAVKAVATVGVETFIKQATAMGITTWKDPKNYGLSIALGGGDVRMIDLAVAFGVLANQGVKVPLHPILQVSNYQGEILEQYDPESSKADLSYLTDNDLEISQGELERVMERAPTYLVSNIMQDNLARTPAFGSNSQLVIKDKVVAAKTGTTNDLKDNWTIGFTPEYLVVTWVGNNDSQSMSYLASGITGAAPIWHDLMAYVLREENPIWPEKPADVLRAAVCTTGTPADFGLGQPNPHFIAANYDNSTDNSNNLLADPAASCAGSQELYWAEAQPTFSGTFRKEYWIRAATGLPPAFGEEATDLALEEHTFYYDPLTQLYCADCNRPVDENGKVQYEQNYVTIY